MDFSPISELEKGSFLIATPEIDGGLFFRSVVLICETSHSGTFGLTINKPMEVEFPEDVIDLNHMSNPNIGIRSGGPVQINQMMILHDTPQLDQDTLEICDQVFLGGELNFLQEQIQNPEGARLRLCFGYAGWGPGQLEKEIIEDSWIICPASDEFIFDLPPEDIWKMLLLSLGGRYAALSMIPEDLSLN